MTIPNKLNNGQRAHTWRNAINDIIDIIDGSYNTTGEDIELNFDTSMTLVDMQDAIDALPNDLGGNNLTITFADGTYDWYSESPTTDHPAEFRIHNFTNGSVTIQSSTADISRHYDQPVVIKGSIRTFMLPAVTIKDIKFNVSKPDSSYVNHCVLFDGATRGWVMGCAFEILEGEAGNMKGLYTADVNAMVYNCIFGDLYQGIHCYRNSKCMITGSQDLTSEGYSPGGQPQYAVFVEYNGNFGYAESESTPDTNIKIVGSVEDVHFRSGGSYSNEMMPLVADREVNIYLTQTLDRVQALIDDIPKNLNGYTATIIFHNGTYNNWYNSIGYITLSGFFGGSIVIKGEDNNAYRHWDQGVILNGGIKIENSFIVSIYDIKFKINTAYITEGINSSNTWKTEVYGCAFERSSGILQSDGIKVFDGDLIARENIFGDLYNGISGDRGGNIFAIDCKDLQTYNDYDMVIDDSPIEIPSNYGCYISKGSTLSINESTTEAMIHGTTGDVYYEENSLYFNEINGFAASSSNSPPAMAPAFFPLNTVVYVASLFELDVATETVPDIPEHIYVKSGSVNLPFELLRDADGNYGGYNGKPMYTYVLSQYYFIHWSTDNSRWEIAYVPNSSTEKYYSINSPAGDIPPTDPNDWALGSYALPQLPLPELIFTESEYDASTVPTGSITPIAAINSPGNAVSIAYDWTNIWFIDDTGNLYYIPFDASPITYEAIFAESLPSYESIGAITASNSTIYFGLSTGEIISETLPGLTSRTQVVHLQEGPITGLDYGPDGYIYALLESGKVYKIDPIHKSFTYVGRLPSGLDNYAGIVAFSNYFVYARHASSSSMVYGIDRNAAWVWEAWLKFPTFIAIDMIYKQDTQEFIFVTSDGVINLYKWYVPSNYNGTYAPTGSLDDSPPVGKMNSGTTVNALMYDGNYLIAGDASGNITRTHPDRPNSYGLVTNIGAYDIKSLSWDGRNYYVGTSTGAILKFDARWENQSTLVTFGSAIHGLSYYNDHLYGIMYLGDVYEINSTDGSYTNLGNINTATATGIEVFENDILYTEYSSGLLKGVTKEDLAGSPSGSPSTYISGIRSGLSDFIYVDDIGKFVLLNEDGTFGTKALS